MSSNIVMHPGGAHGSPAEEAVVLGPAEPRSAPDTGEPDEVQLLHRTATEVRYRARLSRPGLLITRDPWYPGWTVTVNGRPAPLRHADGVLMAVYLPAGGERGSLSVPADLVLHRSMDQRPHRVLPVAAHPLEDEASRHPSNAALRSSFGCGTPPSG